MYFYKNMYISPRVRDPGRVKKDLARGKGHLLIYVLTLSGVPSAGEEAGRPVLEIMHCANLQQPWYRMNPPLIVGLAEGKEDAVELVETITKESFHMTGRWNAAEYLLSRIGFLPEKRNNPFLAFFRK